MSGFDCDYVPGWDCHGLPIEWKVEEDFRAQGRKKQDVPAVEFRKACRAYAGKWIPLQLEEFRRLGIEGDWAGHYETMSYEAEAAIAREFLRVVRTGLVYRGSKPVMWSPVERTSLAEAEVEYQEKTSPTIWVKFKIQAVRSALNQGQGVTRGLEYADVRVVIWTTTPWTIPGNRAISYSPSIAYGIYEVTQAPEDNWAKVGERLILADALADTVKAAARIEGWARLGNVTGEMLRQSMCAHPLRDASTYRFMVPLLPGEHVTEDTGTGFVHTAPGHGTDDFEVWEENRRLLKERNIDATIPFTVDEAGF